MVIHGHIENGMIVPDDGISLPDGTEVTVEVRQKSHIECQPGQIHDAPAGAADRRHPSTRVQKKRIEFPLVKTGEPGSLHLTNDQIQEIFESDDIEAVKAQWNVPS